MLDSREPPHGDFVAFVEKIEREQLARAMQPHKLPHLSAGGRVAADEVARDDRPAPPGAEAQRMLHLLKTQGEQGAAPPRGALIGALLGAALIAFGLLAEGGFVLTIVGAVLLWHNLRKLRRSGGSTADSSKQQVARAFGPAPTGTSRRRNA